MAIRLKGKTWYVYWREEGRLCCRSTGLTDQADAEAVDLQFQEKRRLERGRKKVAAILDGRGPGTTHQPAPHGSGPGDLWKRYVQAPKPRETLAGTEREKENTVAGFVEWLGKRHPGITSLRQVTEQVAAQYMEELSRKGISGQTRNNRRSMLRRVWAVVRVQAGIAGNPWDAVLRVEARNEPKRALAAAEVKKLYAAAEAATATEPKSVRVPGFWPAAIALGWHTGLRFGDVCELAWEELDWEAQELRLVPNKGWRKGDRLVFPMHPDWTGELPKRLAAGAATGTGPLWPEIAAAYRSRQRWLYDEFSALCKAAGIATKKDGKTVVGFHSLRSGLVTAALAAGMKESDVQAAVGHESTAMTQHYNQGREEKARASGKLVARAVESLRNPRREMEEETRGK